MAKHIALIIVATALIAMCIFYPFLPGEYDALATTLSAMAQTFGIAGLILVPFGAVWLAYELRILAKNAGSRSGTDMGYWFGLASIVGSSLVAVVVSFAAFATYAGPSVTVGLIALWVFCAWRLVSRLKSMRSEAVRSFNPAPLYLIVLPIVAAIFTFTLVGPAAEFSRNRAIDNCAGLIADIERYRDVHGHYPRSLHSLHEDYDPLVIGIKRYHYEPSGDVYNVYFEHLAIALDTQEIVMFNKRDEQQFSAHNADLLQYTAAQIARSRGYVAVHNASRPHWKYFLFD